MTELSQGRADVARTIPAWTLGWRLQRSLAHANVSVEQMAHELGVSRSTVSRWLNDRATPNRAIMRVWAEVARVPRDWLEQGELPHLDSNQEPSDDLTETPIPGGHYPIEHERGAAGDILALRRGLGLRGTLRMTQETTP